MIVEEQHSLTFLPGSQSASEGDGNASLLLCNDSDEIPGWTLNAVEKDVLNCIVCLFLPKV